MEDEEERVRVEAGGPQRRPVQLGPGQRQGLEGLGLEESRSSKERDSRARTDGHG